jgi:hypothetical protein
MKTSKKDVWLLLGLTVFFSITGLYIWRVYRVNHSALTDLAPSVQEYSMGQEILLPPGFYNRGYLDQSGYQVQVTDCALCRVNELAERGYISHEEQKTIQHLTDDELIIIVSARFRFEGDGDPLNGIIDMSDYQVVGPDYYINCSTILNETGLFNKFLSGSSAFSIASGRNVDVQIPFIVDTTSVHALDKEFIFDNGIKLLLSRYPVELYVKLELPQ